MVFRKRAGITLSVSMFCIGIGAATAVSVVNLSMDCPYGPHPAPSSDCET